MKLLSEDVVSLRLVPHHDDAMPHSVLLVHGESTQTIIQGATLEAAIAWESYILLFLTDDIPNEDTLRIYLIDSQHKICDWAWLGAMYSTGAFSGIDLSEPATIRFRFIGDTVWTLSLLNHEEFAVPWFGNPRGVHRPCRFKRRFRLTGSPQPDRGEPSR